MTVSTPQHVITRIDKIADAIIHVISISSKHVVLVSPYLQLEISGTKKWTEFNDAIYSALDRGVDVTFITRERDARNRDDAMTILKPYRENGCNVYCLERLHAKIYCCETMALISSMNLTLGSTIKNREIAVVVHGSTDLRSIEQYIGEMKDDYTRRSVRGSRVQSRVKAPDGLSTTWIKVTSRGTKNLHVRIEGKFPCTIAMTDIKSGIEVHSKHSYDCKARIQWRRIRGTNKAFMDHVTITNERHVN